MPDAGSSKFDAILPSAPKPAAGAGGKGSAGSAGGGVSIGGEIQITADPATRSLVVMASYRDFLALRRARRSTCWWVPHVLESPEDARRLHERRLAERREFLERESAFEHRDLDVHVDYAHKSGLLSAVQAEAVHMHQDLRLHEQARMTLEDDVGRRIAPDGSFELTAGEPAAARRAQE